jgi:ATP-dependent Clp protease adaptor protein ClpS
VATLGEKKGKSKGKSLGFEIPENDTEEMVDVVFFNDDVTTVEFVIKVLMTVFFLPKEKAVKLTFKVDEEGSAVAGTYTIDIAKSKKALADRMARAENFPLRIELYSHN